MRNEHFTYSSGRQTIAGTTTGNPITFKIGSEPFKVKKITGSATVPADLLIRISQVSKTKAFSNVLIPFSDIAGTAQLPSYVENLMFDPNQDISIEVNNVNANLQTYSITFIGDKQLQN